MSDDGVPADVLRRRKIFEKLREDVRRLKPGEKGVDLEMTEAEMIEGLNALERILERAEVVEMAREYCDKLEEDAAKWPALRADDRSSGKQ